MMAATKNLEEQNGIEVRIKTSPTYNDQNDE